MSLACLGGQTRCRRWYGDEIEEALEDGKDLKCRACQRRHHVADLAYFMAMAKPQSSVRRRSLQVSPAEATDVNKGEVH
eukprot:10589462-Prorocentrum_lima.AAC.1